MPDTKQDALLNCYLGSVNRWECDENDHMNVRFFAQKSNQALQSFVSRQLVVGGADVDSVLPRVRVQHIRFLREARMAAPLAVGCGVVAVRPESVDILALMCSSVSGERHCAIVTTLDTTGWSLQSLPLVSLAEDSGPRGLDPEHPVEALHQAGDAQQRGYRECGRGVIGDDECDAAGILLPHNYIGRISDGVPNLWSRLLDASDFDTREEGEIGGAAIEYRLRVFEPLLAGSVFAQWSGFRGFGNKTKHIAHLLIDESRGVCAASAEVIAVSMDLTTRRAIAIPDALRARLQAMVVD